MWVSWLSLGSSETRPNRTWHQLDHKPLRPQCLPCQSNPQSIPLSPGRQTPPEDHPLPLLTASCVSLSLAEQLSCHWPRNETEYL